MPDILPTDLDSLELDDLLTRIDQLTIAGRSYAERFERGLIGESEFERCIEELRAIRRQIYLLGLIINSPSYQIPGE